MTTHDTPEAVEWARHIVKEGARYHVIWWNTHGRHCPEPRCEVNR
jgi:hypothetical protein